ncbi:MAG: hypothetical protein DHS20C03_10040 [Minwuia thermotolerans]|nr:MAG: hypothetical protein DHS20C03_10040 [Minwuia thermotolerans]
MRAADTDSDGLRQVALAHFRIFLQQAQHAEVHIFLRCLATASHQGVTGLVPGREICFTTATAPGHTVVRRRRREVR